MVMGPKGVLEGAKAGSMVIDLSSIAPFVSKEIAEALKAKGVRMMDAPVSGGEPGAIQGTLSIMVGGGQADFDESVDMLKTMGKSVVRGRGDRQRQHRQTRQSGYCGPKQSPPCAKPWSWGPRRGWTSN